MSEEFDEQVPAEEPKPAMSEAEAKSAYQWQKTRSKGVSGFPIGGFGPGGNYTLWLAPASARTETVFKNGVPVTREVPDCLSDPKIHSLRDQVLHTMSQTGPTRLLVGTCFLTYAAAIIQHNYDATDEDLHFLLCNGTKWHDGMTRHWLGGDDVVSALNKIGRAELDPLQAAPLQPTSTPVHFDPEPQPFSPAPAPSIWRRFLASFGR